MRIITPEQLAAALSEPPGNPRVTTQGSFGIPRALLGLLDATVPEYRLFIISRLGTLPGREGVRIKATFVSFGLRGSPRVGYYPVQLSITLQLFHGLLPPDVVAVQTSRVVDGRVSLDIGAQVLPGTTDAAKQCGVILVMQINKNLPFIHGDGVLSVDDIDLAVEAVEPVPVAPEVRVDDESVAVGKKLVAMTPDGTTLQLRIDALPGAVMQALQNSRSLRIQTELMVDGFFGLLHSGVLDEIHPITAAFAYGSEELCAWADNNPQLRPLRCETTSSLGNTTRQPAVASIDTASQVDLFGVVSITRVNDRITFGTGGQANFIVRVLQSPGGQAIIALKSWHPKVNRSTIVLKLTEPTTSPQPSWVVTGQNTAHVSEASQRDQALGLIEAVRPEARELLRIEAERMELFG